MCVCVLVRVCVYFYMYVCGVYMFVSVCMFQCSMYLCFCVCVRLCVTAFRTRLCDLNSVTGDLDLCPLWTRYTSDSKTDPWDDP